MMGRRLALTCLVAFAACEHPIAVVTPHIEAADLAVLDTAGAVIAQTQFNRTWSVGSIQLQDGSALDVRLIPIDFRGNAIDLSARPEISFRMEAENPALVQWEPLNGHGLLRPFGMGTTRIRFLIWHTTHADFVTPWLDVVIQPSTSDSGSPVNR
jgi:hypothetical protein